MPQYDLFQASIPIGMPVETTCTEGA